MYETKQIKRAFNVFTEKRHISDAPMRHHSILVLLYYKPNTIKQMFSGTFTTAIKPCYLVSLATQWYDVITIKARNFEYVTTFMVRKFRLVWFQNKTGLLKITLVIK